MPPKGLMKLTKTPNETFILIVNNGVSRVPESRLRSVLSRLTPAGLLKKSGALNLPKRLCVGCEVEQQKWRIIQ